MSSRRPSHGTDGPSPVMSTADANMPVRHPRPLTAAELHLELEKEQEAVVRCLTPFAPSYLVNRLTRELSALRAQHSASVASNASQTSSNQALDNSLSHHTPTRQHRSSSTASSRSISNPSVTSHTNIQHPQPTAPLAGISQASYDRAAAAHGSASTTTTTNPPSISRNPSIRSTSGHSTPALTPASATSLPHRPSISQTASGLSTAGSFGPTSPYTSSSSTADIASSRAELDLVKQENEALRQRVKALERALRSRRNSITSDASASVPAPELAGVSRPSVSAWAANMAGMTGGSVAAPRERSESQSTTTSSRRPEGLEREDSIRVGESAANVGLGLK
ncbi:hypothetical protein D6D18_08108 [Aureobasidium pullulans]|nr:hypothetical protein D6D18_08108 [Aureobasidium pullulans]